ncbi:MAG TPA: HAD family phosphatase [Actinomycetota bacterium]|nr:HAD family phosphatase [Actinomycetota bacterium]
MANASLPRVVCFDVDGTLVPSTTVVLHLAEWLGFTEEFEELERRYTEGEVSNGFVAERAAGYFAGISKTDAWDRLGSLPLIDGLEETLAWLRERSIHTLIGTVTWDFAAEFLSDRYGFDAFCGCRMDTDEKGNLTGSIAQHIEAEEKAAFVREFCEEHGFDLSQAAAVGDSRSDLPLFKEVGLAIALNGSPEADAAADVSIRTNDLRAVIPLLERR